MRRKIAFLAIVAALGIGVLATLGAGPGQGGVPPQPFFPDYLSGVVLLQGAPAPAGIKLVACIDDCDRVFQSAPVQLAPGGKYHKLAVNPTDQRLVGRAISFYLVNEHGRIKATETRRFEGGYNLHIQDLTFTQPLPTAPSPTPTTRPTPLPTPTATPTPFPTPIPTPTAALPVTGDPAVAAIPKLALALGAAALFGGIAMLLLARRRSF